MNCISFLKISYSGAHCPLTKVWGKPERPSERLRLSKAAPPGPVTLPASPLLAGANGRVPSRVIAAETTVITVITGTAVFQ